MSYRYVTTWIIDGLEVDVEVIAETDRGERATRDYPGTPAHAAVRKAIRLDTGEHVPDSQWPMDADEDVTERWLSTLAGERQGRMDETADLTRRLRMGG